MKIMKTIEFTQTIMKLMTAALHTIQMVHVHNAVLGSSTPTHSATAISFKVASRHKVAHVLHVELDSPCLTEIALQLFKIVKLILMQGNVVAALMDINWSTPTVFHHLTLPTALSPIIMDVFNAPMDTT